MGPTPSGCLLAVLLLAAVPSVAAGEGAPERRDLVSSAILIDTEPLPEPLEAGGAPQVVGWTLEFWTTAPAAGEVEIELAVTHVSDLWSVEVEPETVTIDLTRVPRPNLAQGYEVEGLLELRAAAHAPASVTQGVELSAWTEGNELVQPAEGATQFTVLAGWRPGFSASLEPVEIRGDGTALATVELRNEGNGPARFSFTDIQAPAGCEVFEPSSAIVIPRNRTGLDELEVDCRPDEASGLLTACIVQQYARDPSGPAIREPVVWVLADGAVDLVEPVTACGEPVELNATPVAAWTPLLAVLAAALACARP